MKGALVGHIIGGPADPDYDGAVLTADVAVGDTVVHVDDTADFDEDAGDRDAVLLVGVDLGSDGAPDATTGTALAYQTAYDEDGIATYGTPPTEHTGTANTVQLSAASTVTAATGDRIYLQDPVSGGCVGRVEVEVAIDNGDQSGDALPAYVDVALLESVGDVDLTDLAVDLDEDEDGLLYVAGFPGLSQRQGRVRGYEDSHVTTSATDLTFNLTYRPLPNSTVHFYWNGVLQEDDAWSLSGWTFTVIDSGSLVTTGDRFYVKYLYTDPTPKPPPAAPVFAFVGATRAPASPTTVSSIALPTGVIAGDILMLVAGHASFGGTDPVTCTDSRMTVVQNVSQDLGSWHMHAIGAVGTADSSGSAVTVHCADPTTEFYVYIVAYRLLAGTTGTAVGSTAGMASGTGDDAPFVPTLPGGSPSAGLMIGLIYDSVQPDNPHDADVHWTRDSQGAVIGPATWAASSWSDIHGARSAHLLRSDNVEFKMWLAVVMPLLPA